MNGKINKETTKFSSLTETGNTYWYRFAETNESPTNVIFSFWTSYNTGNPANCIIGAAGAYRRVGFSTIAKTTAGGACIQKIRAVVNVNSNPRKMYYEVYVTNSTLRNTTDIQAISLAGGWGGAITLYDQASIESSKIPATPTDGTVCGSLDIYA